ncbi:hypothetical protein XA68_12964 [Ophiocordyceps unilateralis]|uniref:Uncharacterized protein n=1 Tax=Ophiocordyceps unilateralis TaxID=268505 RepID=A0A2A9PDI3_OPHUN|nr:hypothetical protein XA68_12964 [Ophiocordyceps unilateralis]
MVEPTTAAEVFRRHFEARFQPLPSPSGRKAADDDDDQGEDEWMGLSDRESCASDVELDEAVIEVVDHSATPHHATILPTESPPNPKPIITTTQSTDPEDAPSLLAQDLALRRLLSESHLLQTIPRHDKLFSTGRARLRAMDLRLGSDPSASSSSSSQQQQQQQQQQQKKMPMKMRKGMRAAAAARDDKRRRHARENGIVLEKSPLSTTTAAKKALTRKLPRRHRHAVGSMKRAELRLSSRDVDSIQGARDVFGRR